MTMFVSELLLKFAHTDPVLQNYIVNLKLETELLCCSVTNVHFLLWLKTSS